MTFIGKLIRLIVEFAKPSHSAFDPVALIHSAVLVVKFAKPVLHTSDFIALIAAALDVQLLHILGLLLGVGLDSAFGRFVQLAAVNQMRG